METLILINNTMWPWLSEICAVFWLLASIALLRTWAKSRTPDAILVFSYLTILLIVANFPTWGDLSALAVIHLILYTALVWSYGAHGLLRTTYGKTLQNMAALIVFTDASFLALGIHASYHAWILAAIFIAMCVSVLYVCFNSHHNGGNLGKRYGLDTQYNKDISGAVKI